MSVKVIDRLTRKSTVEGRCILWQGARHDRDGWGLIKVDGKVKRVHRVAWEIENGPIPEGAKVRHTCPNRNCWNTAHLVLGDQPEAEPEVSIEVDDDEVAEMRAMYEDGRALKTIANEFDVSVHEVRALAKTWGRVRGAAH